MDAKLDEDAWRLSAGRGVGGEAERSDPQPDREGYLLRPRVVSVTSASICVGVAAKPWRVRRATDRRLVETGGQTSAALPEQCIR